MTDSNHVLTALRDVAIGLEELHSLGYIHRDLHAGNVMVRASGGAVVIDLGHARKANEEPKYRREDGDIVDDMPLMVAAQPDAEWSTQTDVWMFGQLAREVILGFPSDNSYREERELKEEISLPDAGSDGVRCDLPENVKAMLRASNWKFGRKVRKFETRFFNRRFSNTTVSGQ